MGSCAVGRKQQMLKHLTPITYFNKHGIKIKQISVNPSSFGSFFISKHNKLYACGENKCGQLGIESQHSILQPILVPDLQNEFVIDIQSTINYSIAICSHDDPKFIKIIVNWARFYLLPQDLINLVILFLKATKVFATTTLSGTGHLEDDEIINEKGWNVVDSFRDKNIIKCAVGTHHSMFLQDNGVLWTCGSYRGGELGLDSNDDEFTTHETLQMNYLYKPTKIQFFIKEKIVIKDIKCGIVHNIALDINGHVYAWGWNRYGQCGHGSDD